MSDLNDFFAKKDRKKKRAAAAKSAQLAAAQDAAPPTSDAPPAGGDAAAPAQPGEQAEAGSAVVQPSAQKQDDGWIEIEDLRGSQVNTGGRTVAEFRRGDDEKETNGESTVQSEKFSGWNKGDASAEPEEEKEETPAVQPFGKQPASAAFPTLADAAKVRQVAPTQRSGAPAKQPERQRPRLVFDKEKLRKKLEENAKQGA